jgi:hypothetical protein
MRHNGIVNVDQQLRKIRPKATHRATHLHLCDERLQQPWNPLFLLAKLFSDAHLQVKKSLPPT